MLKCVQLSLSELAISRQLTTVRQTRMYPFALRTQKIRSRLLKRLEPRAQEHDTAYPRHSLSAQGQHGIDSSRPTHWDIAGDQGNHKKQKRNAAVCQRVRLAIRRMSIAPLLEVQ
jgi:hypothetical protein